VKGNKEGVVQVAPHYVDGECIEGMDQAQTSSEGETPWWVLLGDH
jgi:hypothetical protein